MPVYTDLLPATKSDPKGQTAIEWAQSTDEFCQIAGTLTIKSKRCYVSYLVEEFATGWDGRGFHLVKLNEGTDKTEEAYTCGAARMPFGSDPVRRLPGR